jgi:hypothetical protein
MLYITSHGEVVMKEFDLRRHKGCSENPIAYLLNLFNEGLEAFVVIADKSVLPPPLAKIIGARKGYNVELLSEQGDEIKLKFTKKS